MKGGEAGTCLSPQTSSYQSHFRDAETETQRLQASSRSTHIDKWWKQELNPGPCELKALVSLGEMSQ